MERPNTVSGLVAKRAELVAYRKGLEAELRKVTVDIDHLDAAIRIFDPATTPTAIKRYATQHRAKKGVLRDEMFAFIDANTDQAALAEGTPGQHFEW